MIINVFLPHLITILPSFHSYHRFSINRLFIPFFHLSPHYSTSYSLTPLLALLSLKIHPSIHMHLICSAFLSLFIHPLLFILPLNLSLHLSTHSFFLPFMKLFNYSFIYLLTRSSRHVFLQVYLHPSLTVKVAITNVGRKKLHYLFLPQQWDKLIR